MATILDDELDSNNLDANPPSKNLPKSKRPAFVNSECNTHGRLAQDRSLADEWRQILSQTRGSGTQFTLDNSRLFKHHLIAFPGLSSFVKKGKEMDPKNRKNVDVLRSVNNRTIMSNFSKIPTFNDDCLIRNASIKWLRAAALRDSQENSLSSSSPYPRILHENTGFVYAKLSDVSRMMTSLQKQTLLTDTIELLSAVYSPLSFGDLKTNASNIWLDSHSTWASQELERIEEENENGSKDNENPTGTTIASSEEAIAKEVLRFLVSFPKILRSVDLLDYLIPIPLLCLLGSNEFGEMFTSAPEFCQTQLEERFDEIHLMIGLANSDERIKDFYICGTSSFSDPSKSESPTVNTSLLSTLAVSELLATFVCRHPMISTNDIKTGIPKTGSSVICVPMTPQFLSSFSSFNSMFSKDVSVASSLLPAPEISEISTPTIGSRRRWSLKKAGDLASIESSKRDMVLSRLARHNMVVLVMKNSDSAADTTTNEDKDNDENKDTKHICDWRGCDAVVHGIKLNKKSTLLCSYHKELSHSVSSSEVKRLVIGCEDAKGICKATDGNVSKAFRKLRSQSSLLCELENGKLAATAELFCKKTARDASSRKSKSIPPRKRLEALRHELGDLHNQSKALNEINSLESKVTACLSTYRSIAAYPSKELSEIRKVYSLLDAEFRSKRENEDGENDEINLELEFCRRKCSILEAGLRLRDFDGPLVVSNTNPEEMYNTSDVELGSNKNTPKHNLGSKSRPSTNQRQTSSNNRFSTSSGYTPPPSSSSAANTPRSLSKHSSGLEGSNIPRPSSALSGNRSGRSSSNGRMANTISALPLNSGRLSSRNITNTSNSSSNMTTSGLRHPQQRQYQYHNSDSAARSPRRPRDMTSSTIGSTNSNTNASTTASRNSAYGRTRNNRPSSVLPSSGTIASNTRRSSSVRRDLNLTSRRPRTGHLNSLSGQSRTATQTRLPSSRRPMR